MARNWNVADAYEALRSGDKEARMDIGRRFPLFATATEDEIIAAIPDYISVRKVEAALKADAGVSEDDVEEVEAEEAEEVKPAKKAKVKKVVEPEEEDNEEEEDEAPKKPVKKAAKAKKPAKKVVEDDDEDDDMDDF